MRSIILLTIVLKCCIELHSRPLPDGQIIKYRVSSKYFNRNNGTSDELYNLLTQIHFGDATQSTTTIETVQKEVETVTSAEQTTNESPEAPTTVLDVTEQQEPEQVKDEQNLHSLIEKVVREEIEKLTSTNNLAQSTEAIGVTEQDEVTEAFEEETTTPSIEFDNQSGENANAESSSTNVPDEQTTHKEHQQNEEIEEYDEEETGNEAPDSLLSAVSDLLSSVLGITVDDSEDDVEVTTIKATTAADESMHSVTTESEVSHSTEFDDEQQKETTMLSETQAADDEKMNEIDEKIENLHVQNTFMTEHSPEIFTETIKSSNEGDDEVLEALSPVADEEDLSQPVSIVNHVMSVIKGAAKDADMQVNDVYSTLKDFGTTFGLANTEAITEEVEDELKSLETNSFDPIIMRNFETDINESVSAGANPEEDNFVPNVAKAAMFHKYQFDEDF